MTEGRKFIIIANIVDTRNNTDAFFNKSSFLHQLTPRDDLGFVVTIGGVAGLNDKAAGDRKRALDMVDEHALLLFFSGAEDFFEFVLECSAQGTIGAGDADDTMLVPGLFVLGGRK